MGLADEAVADEAIVDARANADAPADRAIVDGSAPDAPTPDVVRDVPALDAPAPDVVRDVPALDAPAPDVVRDVPALDAPAPDAPAPDATAPDVRLDAPAPDAARCGNGRIDPGELCDGADCPTACAPLTCTSRTLMGAAPTCNARCVDAPITACTNGDGCCAPGCTMETDNDCSRPAGLYAEYPSEGAEDVLRVRALSPSDVWAVGNGGMILHWDGTRVRAHLTPYTDDLLGLATAAPGSVFACGRNATLLAYNGATSTWTRRTVTGAPPSAEFVAVYANSPTDLWVLSRSSGAFHFIGGAWVTTMLPLSVANDMHGTGPSDLWVVGRIPDLSGLTVGAGTRWNGLSWSPVMFRAARELRFVWASAPNAVVASGYVTDPRGTESGAGARFDGTSWTSVASNIPGGSIFATPPPGQVQWGAYTYERYLDGSLTYGPSRMVVRLDATGVAADVDVGGGVGAVHASSATDVWFGGSNGQLFQRTGTTTVRRTEPPPTPGFTRTPCGAVHAASSTNIWVGCSPGAYHWDGVRWTSSSPFTEAFLAVSAIHAPSPTTAWAVTRTGLIAHFSGGAWAVTTTYRGSALVDVWGASDDDVWITEATGNLLHWNGSAWTSMPGGVPSLGRIWGSSSRNVYAVGTGVDGVVLRWDGTAWSRVTVDRTTRRYTFIAGSGASNVWLSDSYYLARWNGTAWADAGNAGVEIGAFSVGSDGEPVALQRLAPGRTEGPSLQIRSGTTWITDALPTRNAVAAIGALSSRDIIVAGAVVQRRTR